MMELEPHVLSNLAVAGLVLGLFAVVRFVRRQRLWREAAGELWRRRRFAIVVVALYCVVGLLDSIAWRGGVPEGTPGVLSDAPLTVERRLVPGNRVRVRHGPLAGIEGVVLTRRGNTQLLVAVNFLQQGASVEIDDYVLEPIDYVEQDRPRAAKH